MGSASVQPPPPSEKDPPKEISASPPSIQAPWLRSDVLLRPNDAEAVAGPASSIGATCACAGAPRRASTSRAWLILLGVRRRPSVRGSTGRNVQAQGHGGRGRAVVAASLSWRCAKETVEAGSRVWELCRIHNDERNGVVESMCANLRGSLSQRLHAFGAHILGHFLRTAVGALHHGSRCGRPRLRPGVGCVCGGSSSREQAG